MATVLYALTLASSAPAVAAGARGIGGSALRVIPCGALAALVSSVDVPPPTATVADVRAHDAAVQSLVEAGCTVAAVRFRQIFAADEDVCRHLTAIEHRIAGLLAGYEGCVEMRVLLRASDVAPEAPATAPPRTGTAYLEWLRARELPAISLRGALGTLIRDERVSRLREGVAIAHLVTRGDVPRYRDAVRALRPDATVIGPVAFFAFAEVAT